MCGPAILDTHDALDLQSQALHGVYNVQSQEINAALNYDCTTTGANGVCLNIGERKSSASSSDTDSISGFVAASYKINPHLRVGVYANQNLSANQETGVELDDGSPLLAASATLSQNTDGTGFEGRVAAGYQNNDLTLTRAIVGTSQAGTGKTSFITKGFTGLLNYGIAIDPTLIAKPYIGMRYTSIDKGAYIENPTISNPLAISGIDYSSTTALTGLQMSKKITNTRFTLNGSVGVEYDTSYDTSVATAVGVAPGTFNTLNDNYRRFRGTASFGGAFETVPNQAIIAAINYRQESFDNTNSIGVTLAYQIGF